MRGGGAAVLAVEVVVWSGLEGFLCKVGAQVAWLDELRVVSACFSGVPVGVRGFGQRVCRYGDVCGGMAIIIGGFLRSLRGRREN